MGEPQFEVVANGLAATVIAPGLVGKVSVNATPETATRFGLEMVKVSVEVPEPPGGMAVGEKLLLKPTLPKTRVATLAGALSLVVSVESIWLVPIFP